MAEKFFTKVANDVLEASEKLSARLEDGLSAIFAGKLPEAVPGDSFADPGPDIGMDASEEFFMEEEQLLGGSPLQGIAEGVIGDIMSRQVGPQTPMEHFDAFRSAINWREPFILALLGAQVVIFLLCLLVSRRGGGVAPRLIAMLLIAGLVRSADWLNSYGAENWQQFATQNYFDQRGIFVSIMLCGPLLVDSFIMLLCFLREAAQLLVQVKTAELKKKQRMKEAAEDKKRSKKEQ